MEVSFGQTTATNDVPRERKHCTVKAKFERKSTLDEKTQCVHGTCGAHCLIRIQSWDAKQRKYGTSREKQQSSLVNECRLRGCFLRLLPLCHYMGLHDLLILLGLIENRFLFDLDAEDESFIKLNSDKASRKRRFSNPK